ALLVAIAVRESRRAAAIADARRRAGRRRDIVVRADHGAATAVARVGVDAGLAPVAQLVVVAVRESDVAVAVADAARALRVGDMAVGADRAARTAVVPVARRIDLAAVGLLVAIAVREARGASAIAETARAAHRRHVARRAHRAAATAIRGIGLGIDFAAVGL